MKLDTLRSIEIALADGQRNVAGNADTGTPQAVTNTVFHDALAAVRDEIASRAGAKFHKRNGFTTFEMEAALCVWEWVLENSDRPDLTKCFDDYGSAGMRPASTQAGSIVLAVHDKMTENDFEFVGAYDFEFVPAVCERLDWPALMGDNQYSASPYEPDIAGIFADMLIEFPKEFQKTDRRGDWMASARRAAKKQWGYPEMLDEDPEYFEAAFSGNPSIPASVAVKNFGEKYDLIPASDWRGY